jgi:3beta-hydroxy-delta5-steroid dehydrogenase/steroid delta-isomerase
MERVMVTGAAGFLGRHLVQALLDRGCEVRALVRKTPLSLEHPRLEHFPGDVQDPGQVRAACRGVDTVFHTAALIATMGGRAVTREYRDQAFAINVGGTQNIIDACRSEGAARLVYTSSVDVCFDSVEDLHMDEHTPYATTFNCVYTETKIEAEQAVLAANGGDGLLTCALRPDGIWGAGDCIMFQALVEKLLQGPLPARVGGMGAVHDHIHVDNLVHAHLLAAEALQPGAPLCGRAYFVSDGQPAAFFEFVRPLIEGLGHKVPAFSIPGAPLYRAMKAWEWLHFRFGMPAPMLTPHEINKSVISHVVSSAAAQRDFGYRPVKTVEQGMRESVEYFRGVLA